MQLATLNTFEPVYNNLTKQEKSEKTSFGADEEQKDTDKDLNKSNRNSPRRNNQKNSPEVSQSS